MDTIQENYTTSGNMDAAKFAGNASSRKLWSRKSCNNLEVSVIGTSGKFLMTDGCQEVALPGRAFPGRRRQGAAGQPGSEPRAGDGVVLPPAAGQTQLPAN
ncbi:hypothetical protein M4R23_07310 [Acidovorax sp. GBBC 3332]|nr:MULTISPECIES: hypothetical protein [unclassified Acidovorax]MDA8449217.1 hypothetical protein [Acidovorax sp. GBBC 3297]MDA8458695.1 hypothetical protein [Acidovorax sp. GBBC 3333]MDA8463973.1 hypothetical protein [Acidovorax sp. GBBC 3332]MDA8469005.1 hypothetical protein [Acidovorax sp. GBBC 3299]WCM80603.1 hypothetical protein M5C94_10115 [Acidovorax sp. GBBC 712]